jgi:hypothetical protein
VAQLVLRIDKARLYRGRGAELLRSASCLLLEHVARAGLRVAVKTQVALTDVLNENLRHPNEGKRAGERAGSV